jgi:hypothetical protein
VNFEIKGHFTSEKHGPYIQFIPRDLDEQVSAQTPEALQCVEELSGVTG